MNNLKKTLITILLILFMGINNTNARGPNYVPTTNNFSCLMLELWLGGECDKTKNINENIIKNNVKSVRLVLELRGDKDIEEKMKMYTNEKNDDYEQFYSAYNYAESEDDKHSVIVDGIEDDLIIFKDGKIYDVLKPIGYYSKQENSFRLESGQLDAFLSRYGNHVYYRRYYFEEYEIDNFYGFYIDGKLIKADENIRDSYSIEDFYRMYDFHNKLPGDDKFSYDLTERQLSRIDEILKYINPKDYDKLIKKFKEKADYYYGLGENIKIEEYKLHLFYNYIYTELKIMQLKNNVIRYVQN